MGSQRATPHELLRVPPPAPEAGQALLLLLLLLRRRLLKALQPAALQGVQQAQTAGDRRAAPAAAALGALRVH
jgi:hypothetical protein